MICGYKKCCNAEKCLALLQRSMYEVLDNIFTRDICDGENNRYE